MGILRYETTWGSKLVLQHIVYQMQIPYSNADTIYEKSRSHLAT